MFDFIKNFNEKAPSEDFTIQFKFNRVGNMCDLFDDNFDISWQQELSKDIKTFTIIPPEIKADPNLIDDKSIVYIYNNESFRSDDFITNHNGKHILFAGCSEGEGVGGNIGDAWTYILYKMISKEEKCSGFFNLSRAGWGWSKIILNCLIYFKKYGYPDTLFILLPNHQRGHYHNSEQNKLVYAQKSFRFKRTTHQEYLEEFVFFLNHWKTFTELCKLKNIKLIFSTYDQFDSINLNNGPFENYFEIREGEKIIEFMKTYYNTNIKEKHDIRKRDGHAGRIIHLYWANCFYDQYKKIQEKK